jgi:acyl-coenzyme A thioesterase PaaI-like protein
MRPPKYFPGTHYMRGAPPVGFGVQFMTLDDNSVYARIQFDVSKEGPPGYAHGGAVATVLDEAMGAAAFEADRPGFTATMTINYRQSAPLNTDLEVRARVEKIEGNKTFVQGELLLDGKIAAESQGLFIYSQQLAEMILRHYQSPAKDDEA